MNNDILPPRQPKTNIQSKKVELKRPATPMPRESRPGPDEIDIDQASLDSLKPLTAESEAVPAKKVSLSNIRGNLHPKHWYNLTRQEQWVLLAGLIAIFIAIVGSSYLLFFKSPAKVPLANIPPKVKAAPKPVTVASPLSGLQVDPALAKRPVTGIMIENSLDARPQSGLQDAGVVYEAIAEAGITRFLALFQDTSPSYIGPVRSLRPYYIDFATPFDASIAHVGGSPDALSQIRSGGKDLDQFFNSGAYWRSSARDAPHNVYTSFDRLDALNQSKGYTTSTVQSWPRKNDAPSKNPSAKSIDLSPSSYYYNVHYDYDKATNSYMRSEGGKPHMDYLDQSDNTGVQLHPKVVIALILPLSNGELDASGAYYSDYTASGSGNIYVFQDGNVEQGTWTKADRSSQFSFKDAAGNVLKLNAGQTWLTALSGDNQVKYSP
jgi:hypothetical protein